LSTNFFQEKLDTLANTFHPYNAQWEVTARCNASCGYCYIRDNRQPDLSTEDMLRIVDALSENGILTLCISGGEMFLRSDILTILQRVIDIDFFALSLFSNATLLNPRHLEFLIQNKRYIHTIQFSAFSHHAEIHDRYMGIVGAFDVMMSRAQSLRNVGIRVVIAFNIFDFNLKEASETQAFFTQHDFIVHTSIIKLITPSNRNGVPNTLLSEQHFGNCLRQIDDDLVENTKNAMNECLQGILPDKQFCAGIRNFICIDSVGDIRPCSLFTDMVVGNALEKRSFTDMLQSSEAYLRLRGLTIQDLPECNTCQFVGYCQICLGARAFEHGDYRIPDRQRCNLARAAYTIATGKSL
jgi:radical SAM protein with 4Fe4S-binding SPASM domain